MSEYIETNIEAVNSADIAAIETAIAAVTESERKLGRAALLAWLRRRVEDPESEMSVSELIAKASTVAGQKAPLASVLLRSVGGGLLNDIQSTGEAARALINLTEVELPELYDLFADRPKVADPYKVSNGNRQSQDCFKSFSPACSVIS